MKRKRQYYPESNAKWKGERGASFASTGATMDRRSRAESRPLTVEQARAIRLQEEEASREYIRKINRDYAEFVRKEGRL